MQRPTCPAFREDKYTDVHERCRHLHHGRWQRLDRDPPSGLLQQAEVISLQCVAPEERLDDALALHPPVSFVQLVAKSVRSFTKMG